MNRGLVLGIAVFFALVAIALLSGGSQAVAGHGGHGCYGVAACDGCGGMMCHGAVVCGGCSGPMMACGGCACGGMPVCGGMPACGGCFGGRLRQRHHAGLFRRARCGGCGGCAGVCSGMPACCGCAGYPVGKSMVIESPVQKAGAVQKSTPIQKASAAQKVTSRPAPLVYYQVSFRR